MLGTIVRYQRYSHEVTGKLPMVMDIIWWGMGKQPSEQIHEYIPTRGFESVDKTLTECCDRVTGQHACP